MISKTRRKAWARFFDAVESPAPAWQGEGVMPARKKPQPPREPGLIMQAKLQSDYQYELVLKRANELGVNPGTLARILILEHIGFNDPEPNLPKPPGTLSLQVPFQNRKQLEAAIAFAKRHGMSISSFLRGAILPKVGWDPDDDPKFK